MSDKRILHLEVPKSTRADKLSDLRLKASVLPRLVELLEGVNLIPEGEHLSAQKAHVNLLKSLAQGLKISISEILVEQLDKDPKQEYEDGVTRFNEALRGAEAREDIKTVTSLCTMAIYAMNRSDLTSVERQFEEIAKVAGRKRKAGDTTENL